MMSINRLRPPLVSCTAVILENLRVDDLEDMLENFVAGLELNLIRCMEVRLEQIAI